MVDQRLAELKDAVAALTSVARALPDPGVVTTGEGAIVISMRCSRGWPSRRARSAPA